jgi:hypothetical protein
MEMECQECKRIIVRNSNFQRYCKECKKRKDLAYHKRHYKEKYVPKEKIKIQCSCCGKELIRTAHNKKYCKECKTQIRQKYYPEKRREAYINSVEEAKIYYELNKDHIKKRSRNYIIKTKYGLSAEDYNRLLKEQEYKCKICGINLKDGNRTHIDHNHTTNKLRGILCLNCNVGIGMFKENKNLLKEAIKYLEYSED